MTRLSMSVLMLWAAFNVLLGHWADAQEPESISDSQLQIQELSGDTITLDAEEVDIRSALRLLAQARRINIVAGPEVEGTISVNLFEVPFEEALSAILGIGGFTYFRKGDIIYVTTEEAKAELPLRTRDLSTRVYALIHASPTEVADAVKMFMSPSGIAVVRQQHLVIQDAPEYLQQLDDLVLALDMPPDGMEVIEISHADPQEVLTALTALVSPGGKATLTTKNKIILHDSPEYMSRLRAVVAELDTPPRQVLISARILNVTLDDDMSLGVEFESSSIVDPQAAAFDPALPLVSNPRGNFSTLTTGQAGLFSLIVRGNEFAFIEALSKRTSVETLSAPQLLTLDGELAEIQVGEKLGFRITTTTQTSTLESVEFLDVGTLLEVTPTITKDGLVQMSLHPKVSTGNISSDGLPEEKTTEATTTMIVRDGETVMIAGLINATMQRTRNGVPLLNKIPLLGLLFGRRTHTDTKSEVIILITPRIVGTSAAPETQMKIDRVLEIDRKYSGDFDVNDFSRLNEDF